MRRVMFGLLCVVWLGATHRQETVWSSDLQLWHHAVSVEPTSAQAHANLAAQYVAHRWFLTATSELRTALEMARGTSDESQARRIAGQQLRWITIFTSICGDQAWSSVCWSS